MLATQQAVNSKLKFQSFQAKQKELWCSGRSQKTRCALKTSLEAGSEL